MYTDAYDNNGFTVVVVGFKYIRIAEIVATTSILTSGTDLCTDLNYSTGPVPLTLRQLDFHYHFWSRKAGPKKPL